MSDLASQPGVSPLPEWTPSADFIASTNIAWLMQQAGADSYQAVHDWSVQHPEKFWELVAKRLGIRFQVPFRKVLDLSDGLESPNWFVGAKLNIAESCFNAAPDTIAIIYQAEGGDLKTMSYGELDLLSNRVAASLRHRGFRAGDALAILMPMTAEAVAIYLGIVKAGCVVVGIADSFRPKEIATRLRISNAVAVFTQDLLLRGGKEFSLYTNAVEAGAKQIIVLPARKHLQTELRRDDISWDEFLVDEDQFEAVAEEPSSPINILFSSGTTGDPKAIPWNQTTPIKGAMDAHFHQNVQPGDVVVWPTNLGWMMGPWLIFASLVNRATIGLYYGAPTGREFGQFVQNAKATMLGVVPSLVKTWRSTSCMDGLDWNCVKLFSSTGECSNAADMRWLMQFAGGKPVIEYCGGTELGGGYITNTITRPCVAGTFNTPTLGLDFRILDDAGEHSEVGELYLVPPSIGFSTTILNKDHHEVYYADTPSGPEGEILRRHGDQMETLPGGYWRAQGRVDDTMNLGGIKVSSAEIEQVLQSIPNVLETAAVAVSSEGGPSQLLIYAVCTQSEMIDQNELHKTMQNAIKTDLNPLFKIHELVLVDQLPRTASNKVMRRLLRVSGASQR